MKKQIAERLLAHYLRNEEMNKLSVKELIGRISVKTAYTLDENYALNLAKQLRRAPAHV